MVSSAEVLIADCSERRISPYFQAFFRVSSHIATYFCSSLPLIGLCSCVILALYNDFEKATETHCHTRNVLPSVSSAIGDFYWGRLIWRTLIFVHILPRILAAFAYAKLFTCGLESIVHTIFRYITCFLNLLELFCLLMLSVVSSKDNHFRHVLAFSVFQVAGMVHGILHIIMYRISGLNNYSPVTRKSYRVKKACYKWSALFLIICSFLYYRHNSRCEPYVFSAFAFSEYLVVLTNTCFHATFRFDFHGLYIFVF
ncbi:unnamed protein product [Thelazia callipaeda]|uniref:Post-GPI attachment to proteins factor 2 n=1 Tax=Thelazia callipaeda TaxID=103827 RepID=A0A158RCE3_THECL|nr:unnamed protein product [Thelazia callipaeda]